jgi:hypothetical protein
MPRLALHFLGTPRLELDGAAISLSHSKAVAFLAYLSLTHQPHTRQALSITLAVGNMLDRSPSTAVLLRDPALRCTAPCYCNDATHECQKNRHRQ